MNRHRAYWSVMGVEPSNHRQEMREKLKEELNKLVSIHGMDNVITAIRKMKEREMQDKKSE